MTTWYVRPDTTHNSALRDGKSYATAWGGWTEITWGSGGVVAGDTLYVCGSHSYGTSLAIGLHGATSGNRVTIRGDYSGYPGSITFSDGACYIDANRSYTTITGLTINAGNNTCIYPGGAPLIGLWVTNCTFSSGTAPEAAIKFRPFNGWGYQDCIISGNSFSGGSTANTGGSAIQWYNTSGGVVSTVSNLQIYDNTFTGCSSQRAVILLKAFNTVGAGTKLSDIVIRGNTFTDCGAVAVEAYGPETYGVHAGIKIYGNTIKNQTQVGVLGGAFALGGFGPSTTAGFGTNDIYDNWCSGLHGLTGFCNPMYGTYRIFNNYAENITTTDIDGVGVLFDHECKDSVAFGNEFRDIHGKEGDNFESGFGILCLDCTNCTAYGNLFINCLHGVAFGNKGAAQSSSIYNNTFINCRKSGAYLVGGADNTTNIVRNNVFTTTDSTAPAVKVNSAAWTGESYNCFHGFGSPTNHTLAASTITTDPALTNGTPSSSSPVLGAGTYLGGTDFYGKEFPSPTPIGAVCYQPTRGTSGRSVSKKRALIG